MGLQPRAEFAPDPSGIEVLKARIEGLTTAIATLKTTVAACEELLVIVEPLALAPH